MICGDDHYIYWPVAKTTDYRDNEITLSTYIGFEDMSEAVGQFDIWSDDYGYDLYDCRLDQYKNGTKIASLEIKRKYFVVKPLELMTNEEK